MRSLVLALALVLAGGQLVHAKDGGIEKKERLKKMAKELNLSEAQVEKIRSIRKKYKNELKESKTQQKKQRKELKSLMNSSQKGEAFNKTLKEKHSELQKTSNALHDAKFNMMLETRDVLEGDQIKNFKKFKGHEGKRRHRRGEHSRKDDNDDDHDDED